MGNVAETRRQLKTMLDGISGLTAKLGMFYPEDDETTSECFNFVKLNEPILLVGPARYEGMENFLKNAVFSVDLLLYWAYVNFQDQDYTEFEDLMEAVMFELCDMSNYQAANASVPYEMEPFKKKAEHKATPRIVLAEMKLTFKGLTS